MRHVEVGGARVSVIGLGTWQFGSREWGYGDEYAERDAVDIVHRALDLGINLIDTAELYAFGRSERIVGRAIRERRDEAFVATKIFPVLPVAPVVEQRGRASARRLGIDRIDLYQVHQHNPLVPQGTIMEGMRRLQNAGVIDHVGVSNYSLDQWRTAEEALGSPVLSNQVQYSLAARGPDDALVPYARNGDRLVIAYSPLAQGLLAATFDTGRPATGVRAMNPAFLPENQARVAALLAALREVAAAHDATPAQIALAWVIRRPNVVAIPGASRVDQVESNAAAADIELSDEDDARLTEASDGYHPVRGLSAAAKFLRRRLPV